MKKLIGRFALVFVIFAAFCLSAAAQGSYKQPPKEIMDVLNAPSIPTTSVSPARDKIALLEPLRYPPMHLPRLSDPARQASEGSPQD